MFLLSRRQAHAALTGAAAAACYLAAAEAGSKRPVRVGGLFLLASAALAVMSAPVIGNRASAKAYAVEQRFNNLLANGGRIGSDLYMGSDLHMNGNNINNSAKMNPGGENWDCYSGNAGFHGNLFMNGHDIFMAGGVVHP